MARKLKVYRTPIGFHDAYVAASSQKEALRAWGADVDLFARGAAEVVVDEELIREPLDKPGVIVRKLRGTSAEHLAALPKDKPARKRAYPPAEDNDGPLRRRAARPSARETASRETRKPPSKPRPSRAALDRAERAVEEAQAAQQEASADLRRRERELQHERRALDAKQDQETSELESDVATAREAYEKALTDWRG